MSVSKKLFIFGVIIGSLTLGLSSVLISKEAQDWTGGNEARGNPCQGQKEMITHMKATYYDLGQRINERVKEYTNQCGGDDNESQVMDRSLSDICAGNTKEQCDAKKKAILGAMGLNL